VETIMAADDIDNAWKLILRSDDASCDEAARLALCIADDAAREPEDRADALFLLAQVARFFQPWRTHDGGLGLLRRATSLFPNHVDSLLAQCEIVASTEHPDHSELGSLMARAEELRPTMTSDHLQQVADIERRLRK
jgi:hypothetical protein